ncbi:MAG: Rieske 2Fe-2S domain-containing protein [Chloroflexi bacterium]|nr:Rieske 2Fe-2S domain-containing protein [Chloroflexota bacterium]
MACTVLWQGKTFRCPCHESEFERTGNVINSPASQALWRSYCTSPPQCTHGIVGAW